METENEQHLDLSPSDRVATIGRLLAKDLPNALILPEYPSTFNLNSKLLNNEKYFIHDNPPYTDVLVEYLEPVPLCVVVGNELPILLRQKPVEKLRQHWKRWLPFFPEADIRDLTLEVIGESTCITQYPLQWLPREKHAIDPDVHHKLLSKNTIPLMGANCARHMSLDDYTVPCMIKASHGAAGRGTFMARTKDEAAKIINEIQTEFKCPNPSISEVIEDISGNHCVQFYLDSTGEVKWLGVTNQDIDEQDFGWEGSHVNWEEQDELEKKLHHTVMPVEKYLHENGYFGVVGIDVLCNKDGNYVVDVNARINGSSLLLFIGPHMERKGFPIGAIFKMHGINCNEVEIIEKFDKINSSGNEVVINLASANTENAEEICDAVICIFAKDEKSLKNLRDKLENFKNNN